MKLSDYFAFTRSERRAIIVLTGIIVVLAIAIGSRPAREVLTPSSEDAGTSDPLPDAPSPTLFAFNPNTADSSALRSLGLSAFVVSNIVKYRRAGGHFRRPDDLSRIYGLDSATFLSLRPYIFIPAEPAAPVPRRQQEYTRNTKTSPAGQADTTARQENPYKEYMENKLHEGNILDLNQADSATLVRLPGIGEYYAHRIILLRRELGGFVSMDQLNDIENLPDIGDWVYIVPDVQQRINVNTASLRTLKNHPYIGYSRARAIVNLRQRSGRIANLRQLSFLDEFTDDDIRRLEPYLSFE